MKDLMHIALHTSPNRPLILSMIASIKQQFPKIDFRLQDMESRGLQLQLLGASSEALPMAWAEGFAAAWDIMELRKSDTHEEITESPTKETTP